MAGSLLIRVPRGGHFEVRLGQTRTLGRAPDQNVQIHDMQVSRGHAAIAWADGDFWIQDRSSKNGTYLNGLRIYGPTRLCDGDIIRMGGTKMIFSDDCRRRSRTNEDMDDARNDIHGAPADRLSMYEFPSVYSDSSSGSVND